MQAARSPCTARWPEAQAQLRSDGIALDIKTLRSTAYRYAARARAAQQSAACGLLDRVTGKRVVVSLDGGRVRVRRKKRGPKTKKGRNRFHTDWKEPKLLILYVVGDDGRPSQTWAPIIDGTLRGPEAVFALLLSYARQIGLNAADKVLFIADGAPWIWRRLQRLIAALGLSPTQVLGLIDFYHAAKQLSDAVKLRRWSATQRTRWLNRTRGLLKRARVDEVITALRELCRRAHRPQAHGAVVEAAQALVADGDPVGVAAEVVEDLFGTGEGPLRVDDPFGLAGRAQVLGEAPGVREGLQPAGEAEFSGLERVIEGREQDPAEVA